MKREFFETSFRKGREISRADVADFMHLVVVDERTIRKVVALTY